MRNKNQKKALAKAARSLDKALGPNCREGRHSWDYDDVYDGDGTDIRVARCRCGIDTFGERAHFVTWETPRQEY